MAFSRINITGLISSRDDYKQTIIEFSGASITNTPTSWIHNTLAVPSGSARSNPGISLDLQNAPGVTTNVGHNLSTVQSVIIKNTGANPVGIEYWTLLESFGPGSFEVFANGIKDKSENDAFINCHPGNFLLLENADEANNNRLVLVVGYHPTFPDRVTIGDPHTTSLVADGGDTNITFKRLQRNEIELGVGISTVISGGFFPISLSTFESGAASSLFETEQHELQMWGSGGASAVELLVMGT